MCWGGPRGVPDKVLYGKVSPRAPNPYPLNTIVDRKGTRFVHPLLTNGTPFTYQVYNFPSPLSAVNSLSLKYENIERRGAHYSKPNVELVYPIR